MWLYYVALKGLINNVSTKKINLDFFKCMALHAISVFAKV